jgi:hypothetical protein
MQEWITNFWSVLTSHDYEPMVWGIPTAAFILTVILRDKLKSRKLQRWSAALGSIKSLREPAWPIPSKVMRSSVCTFA